MTQTLATLSPEVTDMGENGLGSPTLGSPETPGWTEQFADPREFDTELTVRRVVPITHDVTSFVFDPPPGRTLVFEPGQHIVLQVPVGGETLERCYTISSPPTRPGSLAITVKRHPDGPVSNWLHDHVRPGDRLRVRGPHGAFTYRDDPAMPSAGLPSGGYLFLSAGSGITPLMSMTRTLLDEGSQADVVFVHSARTPADIIFRRELDALAEGGLPLRVIHVCEEDSVGERWHGARGRLSADLLRWAVPDVAERQVFLCGPPGYMNAVKSVLVELGVPDDRVHVETFTIAEAPPAAPAPDAAGLRRRVELRRSGKVVDCDETVTVLDALMQAGVLLRSSCRQGMCGTCKSTLLEGEVDMQHQGGIRQREIDRGSFLPCCSYPRSDLVIDA